MVRPQRVHQRGLVVGRATHPAVRHARPLRDGIPLPDEFLARAGDAEKLVSVAARPGVGRRGERVLGLGVVQGVVEPGDRACGVAKGGMRGHIVDALAIDVDLSPVAQTGEIFRTRERSPLRADGVLGLRGAHGQTAPPHARSRQQGTRSGGCQCMRTNRGHACAKRVSAPATCCVARGSCPQRRRSRVEGGPRRNNDEAARPRPPQLSPE